MQSIITSAKRNPLVQSLYSKFKYRYLQYYQVDNPDNTTTIVVEHIFKKPIINLGKQVINPQVQAFDNKTHITLGIDNIPQINGISAMFTIRDKGYIYYLIDPSLDENSSYNNIKSIWYTEENIYYFRNEIKAPHRLLLQSKLKLSYESQEYQQMIEELFALNLPIDEKKVVFFEKESNQFEESARVLFEKLYPNPNVYFVLNKNHHQFSTLKKKYNHQLVSPGDKDYIKLLITAKYYIGTESTTHLLSLRSPYKLLRNEVLDCNRHDFIFLQHGVSYGITHTDSSRQFFRKDSVRPPSKVIVSSDLEAKHFTEVCGFSKEDLWKTGLANYDNKQIKPNCDKITIMLTWRPWEEQNLDITKTSYYQALESIVACVEDKSKLQIIFHPKVKCNKSALSLSKYFVNDTIDVALSETKLLISDYSSVVFDSFNRGSNVIFWWVEKKKSLTHYNGTLLLTKDNVFGDIANSNTQLPQLIENNYNCLQQAKYVEKFKKIVEFSDNNNTNRIIEKLQNEGIIT